MKQLTKVAKVMQLQHSLLMLQSRAVKFLLTCDVAKYREEKDNWICSFAVWQLEVVSFPSTIVPKAKLYSKGL